MPISGNLCEYAEDFIIDNYISAASENCNAKAMNPRFKLAILEIIIEFTEIVRSFMSRYEQSYGR
jgi:hypothetical protein